MPNCSSSVRRTATAGVITVLADGDEAKEHAASGLSSLLVEADVDRLGAPADRAGQTAGFLERGERDHVALPPGEELDHRVLHERQGAGLQRGLGRDPLDQRRLDSMPTPAAGSRTASASSASLIAPIATVRPLMASPTPG